MPTCSNWGRHASRACALALAASFTRHLARHIPQILYLTALCTTPPRQIQDYAVGAVEDQIRNGQFNMSISHTGSDSLTLELECLPYSNTGSQILQS